MTAHQLIPLAGLLLLTMPALAEPPMKCGRGHFPPCPVGVPPIIPTLSIAVMPANPVIPDTALIGTVLAIISVIVSDGSPFFGSLGFGEPYGSAGGFCAIDGTSLVLGLPPIGPGVVLCTITATQ